MENTPTLRVAIVHDWLYGGGAERVVQELHTLYPEAPIYTSYCTEEWRQKLDNKVVTGYLNRWPFNQLRKFLPLLRIWWFRSLDLSDYDLVISSSGNGEAKHIKLEGGRWKTEGDTANKPTSKAVRNDKRQMINAQLDRQLPVHVCYTHTPVHFYWRHYDYYLKQPGFGIFNPLARLGLRLLVRPLRKADYKAAQKVDYFIANSNHIKDDIKRYYGRDAAVVHPPVDIDRFKKVAFTKREGFVTVGRLVPNKRVDVIVQACSRLNLPLTVVGRGPDLPRLKKLAGPSVVFDTVASDQAVVEYMARAKAFLFASFEDFGITPVEAMAAGTPVIAYKAGGALDYIQAGKTGMFFEEQTAESLITALTAFDPQKYSSDDIKKAAEKFSSENFRKNLRQTIISVLQ